MTPKEQRVVRKVQEALIAGRPGFGLKKRYHGESHPLGGYCSRAAEAVWHLLGGHEAGYTLHSARDTEGGTHWWVQSQDGAIIDPTAEQYTSAGLEPPYVSGVRKSPSSLRNPKMLDRPSKDVRDLLSALDTPQKKQSARVRRSPHYYPWGGHEVDAAVDAHPHTTVPEPPVRDVGNEQAVQRGTEAGDYYRNLAQQYGTLNPGATTSLQHYDYRAHEPAIDKMLGDKGYEVYYAGGKYGKPQLESKNYNTGHLMVYDPSPGTGGDFNDEATTRTWRKVHELAHAETYGPLNEKYGEGRRVGKLGTHRTLREAKRAVEWEWLAVHRQRELSEELGYPIDDATFNKECNTTLHDAVHRAVTGKFTNPDEEGFVPSDKLVPLEVSLRQLEDAARAMGLKGEDDVLPKRRTAETVSRAQYRAMVHKAIRAKLLGEVEGLSVYKIDGTWVRDNLDVDFVSGGHACRYGYIPLAEVWVEDGADKDVSAAIVHEVTECDAMASSLDYEAAHAIAAEVESHYRSVYTGDHAPFVDAAAFIRSAPEEVNLDDLTSRTAALEDRVKALSAKYPDLGVPALVAHDPTPNGKYLNWIVNLAKRGVDLSDAHHQLAEFEELGGYGVFTGPERDIGSVKTLDVLAERNKLGADRLHEKDEANETAAAAERESARRRRMERGPGGTIGDTGLAIREAKSFNDIAAANINNQWCVGRDEDTYDRYKTRQGADARFWIVTDASDDEAPYLVWSSDRTSEMKNNRDGKVTNPDVLAFIKAQTGVGPSADDIFEPLYEEASARTTSPRRLRQLARHEVFDVRKHVALNPMTPPAVLATLATDEDSLVRAGAAENVYTPPSNLVTLAQDEDSAVREGIAKNISTPPFVLASLATEPNKGLEEPLAATAKRRLLFNIARNTSTPSDVLQMMADGTYNEGNGLRGAARQTLDIKNQRRKTAGLMLHRKAYQRYVAEHVDAEGVAHKIWIGGAPEVDHESYEGNARKRRSTTWIVKIDGEEVGAAPTLREARSLAETILGIETVLPPLTEEAEPLLVTAADLGDDDVLEVPPLDDEEGPLEVPEPIFEPGTPWHIRQLPDGSYGTWSGGKTPKLKRLKPDELAAAIDPETGLFRPGPDVDIGGEEARKKLEKKVRPLLTSTQNEQLDREKKWRKKERPADTYVPTRSVPPPSSVTLGGMNLRRNGGLSNILEVLRHARPDQVEHYKDWYSHAHEDAAGIAAKFPGVSPDVVTAVIAIMSPNLKWDDNLFAAQQMLRGVGRGVAQYRQQMNIDALTNWAAKVVPTLYGDRKTLDVMVYLPNILKAQRIIDAAAGNPDFTVDVAEPIKLAWNPVDESSVEEAERIYNEKMARGWTAYTTKVTGDLDTGGTIQQPITAQKATPAPTPKPKKKKAPPKTPEQKAQAKERELQRLKERPARRFEQTWTQEAALPMGAPFPYRERRLILNPPFKAAKTPQRGKNEGVTGDLPKVTAFHESIRAPEDHTDTIVLDGHAINIWRGAPANLSSMKNPPEAAKVRMRADYKRAAAQSKKTLAEVGIDVPENLSPQAVQAITWTIWRDAVGGKDEVDEGESGEDEQQPSSVEQGQDVVAPVVDREDALGDQLVEEPGGVPSRVGARRLEAGVVEDVLDEFAGDGGHVLQHNAKVTENGDYVNLGFADLVAVKRDPLGARELQAWFAGDDSVTCLSARYTGDTISATKQRHQDLLQELEALGVDARQTRGVWRQGEVPHPEPSVVVRGLSFSEALALAKGYMQEAFIYKEPGGAALMYEGYRKVDTRNGVKPSITVPLHDGQPLFGEAAIKAQPRLSKEKTQQGPAPGDLMVGTRSLTFEIPFDWTDAARSQAWDGTSLVTRSDVEALYGTPQPKAPGATPSAPAESATRGRPDEGQSGTIRAQRGLAPSSTRSRRARLGQDVTVAHTRRFLTVTAADVVRNRPEFHDVPAAEPKREPTTLRRPRSKDTPGTIALKPGGGYDNIMKVLALATPEEVGYWGKWYRFAAAIVREMATKYDLPVETVAGVVAVMSPGNRWHQNIAVARQIIEHWQAQHEYGLWSSPSLSGVGGPKEIGLDDLVDEAADDDDVRTAAPYDFKPKKDVGAFEKGVWTGEDTEFAERGPKSHPLGLMGPHPSGYPRNSEKALAILGGAPPASVVTGPKVTVFYESLLDPDFVKDRLVLDGHAINLWRGEKQPLKGLVEPTSVERERMLADYAKAAEASGLSVQAVQAITWYIWKNIRASKTALMREKDAPGESAGVFLRVPHSLAKMWPRDRGGDDSSPPHFTVLYLGPMDAGRKDELVELVAKVASDFGPIPIELSPDVSWFENDKGESIAHKGVHPKTLLRLEALHDALSSAATSAGFEVRHKKPFIAHSTLAYCDGRTYDGPCPEGGWSARELEVWGWPEDETVTLGSPFARAARWEEAVSLGGPIIVTARDVSAKKRRRQEKRKRFMGETYWLPKDGSFARTRSVDAGADSTEIRLDPGARVLHEGDRDLLDAGGAEASLDDVMKMAFEKGYDAVRVKDRLAILNQDAVAERTSRRPGWSGR